MCYLCFTNEIRTQVVLIVVANTLFRFAKYDTIERKSIRATYTFISVDRYLKISTYSLEIST